MVEQLFELQYLGVEVCLEIKLITVANLEMHLVWLLIEVAKLEKIAISMCFMLTKFPINNENVDNLRHIEGNGGVHYYGKKMLVNSDYDLYAF